MFQTYIQILNEVYIRTLARIIVELQIERRNAIARLADQCSDVARIAKQRKAYFEIAYDKVTGGPSFFQFGSVPKSPRFIRIGEATPAGDLVFDSNFQAVLA